MTENIDNVMKLLKDYQKLFYSGKLSIDQMQEIVMDLADLESAVASAIISIDQHEIQVSNSNLLSVMAQKIEDIHSKVTGDSALQSARLPEIDTKFEVKKAMKDIFQPDESPKKLSKTEQIKLSAQALSAKRAMELAQKHSKKRSKG